MSTTIADFFTIDEAAAFLGIADSGVRRYCRLGRLKAERKGNDWLIPKKVLVAFKRTPRPRGNPNFKRS